MQRSRRWRPRWRCSVPRPTPQDDVGAHELEQVSGVRLQIDNDLFAGGERDRDYTGGMAITISGTAARDGLLSLDPLLTQARRAVRASARTRARTHARQIGLMAFTPSDTITREAQQDDRPYASLLFAVERPRACRCGRSRRLVQQPDGRRARSVVHRAVCTAPCTKPWARKRRRATTIRSPAAASRRLATRWRATSSWIADPSGRARREDDRAGQRGLSHRSQRGDLDARRPLRYAVVELRAGADRLHRRAGAGRSASACSRELYFFAGARIKARAYNAFLQGQFRDSAVTLLVRRDRAAGRRSLDRRRDAALRTDAAELHAATTRPPSCAKARRARDALWGGVQLAHSF